MDLGTQIGSWRKRFAIGSDGGRPARLVAALLAAIGVSGALLAWWSVERTVEQERLELSGYAKLVAEAQNVERVAHLLKPGLDRDDPVASRIRRQLEEIRTGFPRCRDVHLLVPGPDGSVVHLAASDEELQGKDSFRGLNSDRLREMVGAIHAGGLGQVWGPWSDDEGSWMVAMEGVRENRSGAIVAVAAMRFDVGQRGWHLTGRALPYAAGAIVLMGVALWGVWLGSLVQTRPRASSRFFFGGWIVAGTVVTALVAWELNRYERRQTHDEFQGFVLQKALTIVEKIRIVRETEMESLVRFVAGSEHVSGAEFQQFSSFLMRNPLIHTWAWIVRVDSSDRKRFEDSVGREWKGRSGIWESGEAGPIPARRRAYHLVVADMAPREGRESRLGFDYLSDPMRLAALEEAEKAKIPVSTPLFRFTIDGKPGSALLLMRPVFESHDSSRLRGLVVASMEPIAPLRAVADEQGVRYELLRLRADSAPEVLAVTDGQIGPDSGRFEATVPFLGFGKVFAVRIKADDRSLRAPSHHMGITALLLGILATLGAVALYGGLLRRRDQLQSLVEERTDALQSTEQSYRDQFQANNSVMLLIDPRDRRIVDANEAACRFYGHPRERLLEMRITDIDRTPDGDVGKSPDGDYLGRGKRHEFRHRLADGQVRDVEISSSFVRFGGGQVLHAIVHDVTERKRIESERKILEQRLEWALQATGDGVWDWNIATGTVKHNARWCQILGLDESFLQHPLEAFGQRVHPEDRERVMANLESSLRNGEVFRSEHRMVRLDGQIVDVLDRGRVVERDQDGEPLRMVGSMVDVTELKRAERELRASETRLKMVMDLARIAPWECDLQTGVFQFNDQFYALYGTDADAQGGYSMDIPTYLERFIAPDSRKSAGEAIARSLVAFDGDGLQTLEHSAVRGDGSPMEVAVSYRIVRDASGKAIRTIGANQDITERKRAEEELRETNSILEEQTARANALAAEAEMATVAKSEFLANMSHEIRTPMNGVIGMTGLLLDTELTGEQRRFAEIVKQSSESLLALLNDILDFSKIEAGKLEMENLDFDLRGMLDDFAVSLALRAEEKGLEFVIRMDSDVPRYLRGDPGRLRQVLMNLAGNAVKFTKHGEVFVRVGLLREDAREAELRFSVKDTGIGIPPEKISILFNKFTQVDASTTRQFGGTGLGLAISKQLCEMMDGTIGIASEEGKGSEFWFTARFSKQESSAVPGLALPSVQGARILVVDDNQTCREVVGAQIQAWGGRVESAAGGEEAIASLVRASESGDPFRVAILDLSMPGMDGGEVLGRVRSDSRTRDTRFVLMTSMGRMRDRRKVVPDDDVSFLPKPVRQSDLFDVLAEELSGGGERKTDRVVEPLASPSREARSRPVRVLLAEDNVVNQMVARGILEKVGVRVDVAGNGIEAIEALRSLPYDLVFLDVQMPEMDGLEASRRIRAGDAGDAASKLPLIAMTANAMQGDREICLAAGMDDYVTKPVSPKELVAMMDKWATRSDMDPVTTFFASEEPDPDDPLDLPVFDRDGFLGRVLDNEALARKVVGSFLETIPGLIESLKPLVDSGDAQAAGDLAHGIKGAAANVGAEALRDMAARMESAGRARDLAALKEQQPLLEARYEALRKVLETAF
ncbi:MAG TPA: response regulator [Fibrobacteria bacterium]|nr:response regulator [Fibrobacteria bacterium]